MTGNAFLIDDWLYISAVIDRLSGKEDQIYSCYEQQSCDG
jgi:hypothetical protein